MKKRLLIIFGSLLALAVIAWLWPLPGALRQETVQLSTRVLDRHGELLYVRQRGGIRESVALEKIPRALKEGLIATEDRTYYSHPGVSLRGIGRAFLHNLGAGRIKEGGSTITQQLVRTLSPPAHRGWISKIREAWLALKLDARLSKDEILERFLNHAYFGQQAYGVQAAASAYFNKNLADLSQGECALLVGLLNAPSSLNPFKDKSGAIARREIVLSAMRDAGVISVDDEKQARSEPVRLSHGKTLINAPHFVMWLLSDRASAFDQVSEVRTTLDLQLQREVEDIVGRQLLKLVDKNVSSASVVVLDAVHGDILAMVGSGDYFDDERDGAVNTALAPRQPGSALKPFTYALAFSRGMTPATTVTDIETQFFTQEGNPYIPRNYDFGYHGLVRLREALANSYNIAAVKVLEAIGVKSLLDFLASAGISTLHQAPEYYGLALTLGDSEVTLLELSQAYGIFAREGRTLKARALLSDPESPSKAILEPRIAWLIADILSDNDARTAEFGTSSPLLLPFPSAAKTGTTRNSRDNWTIGFTPHRIVGVWVGNADNTPMRETSGITGAAPIYRDTMVAASRGLPVSPFVRPEGIVDRIVCRLSGKLPTPFCTNTTEEHFLAGTEPEEPDDIFREFSIDSRNGLLATADCPATFVTRAVFAMFPSELQRWARENGWKSPPRDLSPLCDQTARPPGVSRWLSIARPHADASFRLDPLIPDERELVIFEADASSDIRSVDWLLDGKTIGRGYPPDFRFEWKPHPGSFTVRAAADGLDSTIRFSVEKP